VPHSNPSLAKILHPYFGGHDTAYKDIKIKIR